MEQHPVPQNISSYEFRLVGDMTLKQFFQLAAGVIVGIIFFRLPIAGIFKYPLTFLAVIIGVLSAFVPFQGRPFNQWLVAFFRAIYSPTEFVWSPTPIAPPVPIVAPQIAATTTTTGSQNQIITGFMAFFSSLLSPKSTPKITVTPVAPAPQIPVAPVAPPPPPAPIAPPTAPIHVAPTPPPPPTPTPAKPTTTQFSTLTKDQMPKPPIPPTPPTASNRPSIQVQPRSDTPTPAATAPQKPLQPTSPFPGLPKITPPSIIPPAASTATVATPVAPPTIPNVLAGIVTDPQNLALSGCTVEIIDSHTGIPARALRTNRLGQFQIAIPLPTGSYIINTEKTGVVFDPVSVLVNNSLIPPIIIKSKS